MAKIDEDSPPLFGRLDLLGLDHSAQDLVFVDFKTSKQRWSDEDIQRNGDQLRLTSLASRTRWASTCPKCLFIVLVKTKQPAIQVLEFDPSPAQADELGKHSPEFGRRSYKRISIQVLGHELFVLCLPHSVPTVAQTPHHRLARLLLTFC